MAKKELVYGEDFTITAFQNPHLKRRVWNKRNGAMLLATLHGNNQEEKENGEKEEKLVMKVVRDEDEKKLKKYFKEWWKRG